MLEKLSVGGAAAQHSKQGHNSLAKGRSTYASGLCDVSASREEWLGRHSEIPSSRLMLGFLVFEVPLLWHWVASVEVQG